MTSEKAFSTVGETLTPVLVLPSGPTELTPREGEHVEGDHLSPVRLT